LKNAQTAASLTEGLVELLARPIGEHDRRRAALHLIDWLGCAIAGSRTATARALAPALSRQVASGLETNDHPGAALAFDLGALGSILEMDDVDRRGLIHPGPVVFAAATALSQGRSGHAVLDAVVRGYEAMIRLGRAVGAGHYAFFHNTATTGGFGAAVAAGSLLGLTDRQLVWAMGNAASLAGGLWQCRHEQVMTKTLHCAEASRRGTHAALLSGNGVSGPRFILEGAQGFFAAMCPDGRPGAMLDPEDTWLIHDVSFKPWPACRHAHAAIDAALALRDKVAIHDIAAIEIETYADAVTFCDRVEPRSETEAKFSLQHAVAVALVDGPPALEAFAVDRLDRPEIAALRVKASARRGDGFTAAYPRHFGASVAFVTHSGERLVHTVDDAWGDSENPMPAEAIRGKFHALLAHSGLNPRDATAMAAAAMALADDAPFQPLRAALASALHTT
jgi:2-methylcitrate dehydratase PrpD